MAARIKRIGHFIREVLLALLFLVGSCFVRLDGQIDSMPLARIAPPAVAESAWAYDLACSHLTPKFPLDSVQWYIGDMNAHSQTHNWEGYWDMTINNVQDSLAITLDINFINDFTTIAHELMHYIRQVGGHPDEYFKKCNI